VKPGLVGRHGAGADEPKPDAYEQPPGAGAPWLEAPTTDLSVESMAFSGIEQLAAVVSDQGLGCREVEHGVRISSN
jgi:hypothetical protein